MAALLILEPFVPARFGVTGRTTVIISRTTARYRVVPTNARANRAFTRSFSPGDIYIYKHWFLLRLDLVYGEPWTNLVLSGACTKIMKTIDYRSKA